MDYKNIKSTILDMLQTREEERKPISLSLPESLLDKIDLVGEQVEGITGKKLSRQALIESALIAYLDDFTDILESKFGIKLEELSNFQDIGFDTLLVPARQNGSQVFLSNQWYTLRIGKDKIDHIKYLALYVGAPISAVKYYAPVKKIVPYGNGYKAILGTVSNLNIPLGNLHPTYTRPNRYLTLERLKAATVYADLLDE